MVPCQLCTLEQLITSGFGRPFPRHGLQLLFWFANHCVTFELDNFVEVMKMVTDCQPETGTYGFHLFGNMEDLLPALHKPKKRKRKGSGERFLGNGIEPSGPSLKDGVFMLPTQLEYGTSDTSRLEIFPEVTIEWMDELRTMNLTLKEMVSRLNFAYFVVGNLNSETYPSSANLPTFVRENYGFDGDYLVSNMDRVIISYEGRSRVVEAVYVTEHDAAAASGRFRSDRTHEVSPELVRALQNPQLDISGFLIQMGYYRNPDIFEDREEIYNSDPAAQLILSMMQNDHFGFFSEAFSQHLDMNFEPLSYEQYGLNINSHNSEPVVHYGQVKRKKKKAKAIKKPRAMRELYWDYNWMPLYKAFDEEEKKRRGGGGFSCLKILLGVGAVYLAAKCISWSFRNVFNQDWNQTIMQMMPGRTQSYPRTHIMLDYVY